MSNRTVVKVVFVISLTIYKAIVFLRVGNTVVLKKGGHGNISAAQREAQLRRGLPLR
jgi:hypothetical protein